MSTIKSLLTVVLAVFLAATCAQAQQSAAQPAPLKPVSLVLHWDHQAQFAGYYLAVDKGFYAKEGLDVTIIRGGPDVHPCEMVAEGKAQFCTTMLSTALEKRDGGIPLVLVAQIVNRSNYQIVAWKRPDGEGGPEITKPSDLNRRKVTVWEGDFRLLYTAFFESQGVRPQVLPQYYSLSLFINHGADACTAMSYNEFHWLLQHGVNPDDVIVFPLAQYGIPMPEDGIYALESTVKTDPQMCRAFAKATMEGWKYAKEHPDEAMDAVMTRVGEAKLPTNGPHMSWMLMQILDSAFPSASDKWVFGKLSEDTFNQASALLKRYGAIKNAPDYATFVKLEASGDVGP